MLLLRISLQWEVLAGEVSGGYSPTRMREGVTTDRGHYPCCSDVQSFQEDDRESVVRVE